MKNRYGVDIRAITIKMVRWTSKSTGDSQYVVGIYNLDGSLLLTDAGILKHPAVPAPFPALRKAIATGKLPAPNTNCISTAGYMLATGIKVTIDDVIVKGKKDVHL